MLLCLHIAALRAEDFPRDRPSPTSEGPQDKITSPTLMRSGPWEEHGCHLSRHLSTSPLPCGLLHQPRCFWALCCSPRPWQSPHSATEDGRTTSQKEKLMPQNQVPAIAESRCFESVALLNPTPTLRPATSAPQWDLAQMTEEQAVCARTDNPVKAVLQAFSSRHPHNQGTSAFKGSQNAFRGKWGRSHRHFLPLAESSHLGARVASAWLPDCCEVSAIKPSVIIFSFKFVCASDEVLSPAEVRDTRACRKDVQFAKREDSVFCMKCCNS